MRLQILDNIEPELAAAYEEAIITAREKGLTEDVISLWKHPKAVYMVYKGTVLGLDMEYLKTIDYPVSRSSVFIGKNGSLIIIGGTLGLAITIGKDKFNGTTKEFADKFYNNYGIFIANKYGVNLENIKNDLFVSGTEKKVGGCVFFQGEDFYHGNSVFTLSKPEGVDMVKILSPGGDGNLGVKITAIQDECGITPLWEDIVNYTREYFLTIYPDMTEEVGLNNHEKGILDSVKEKHLSEDWIKYGRIRAKPDFN